jgi:hypothetical protein
VFEEISGLPLHPLLVHAAVIFVPLQVLSVYAYALLPFARRFLTWLVVALAVVGPVSAFAAKLSGDAFRRRLVRNHMASRELLSTVAQHSNYANLAVYGSTLLGVLTVLLVVVLVARARRPRNPEADKPETTKPGKGSAALVIALTVVALGIGAGTGFFVFKAGDTGARMEWSGR